MGQGTHFSVGCSHMRSLSNWDVYGLDSLLHYPVSLTCNCSHSPDASWHATTARSSYSYGRRAFFADFGFLRSLCHLLQYLQTSSCGHWFLYFRYRCAKMMVPDTPTAHPRRSPVNFQICYYLAQVKRAFSRCPTRALLDRLALFQS